MYLETTQPAFWPAALLRRTSVFAAGENLGTAFGVDLPQHPPQR